MAKDLRSKRKKNNGALMGALGIAMTAGSQWYDKTQQEEAKALREAELLKLKKGELDLGYKKLDASDKLGKERNRISEISANASAQQAANQQKSIENIQSRAESADKKSSIGTFLTKDFESWKSNYVGDDDDAKLRAKAWGTVLENGLESYTDEQLVDISAKISEQFGVGTSGKAILSPTEITQGLGQLRTYAKLRGLSIEDVSDDDINSLLSSSFTMGAEPVEDDFGAGGGGGGGTPTPEVDDGVFGMGLSEATQGIGSSIGESLRGYPDRSAEAPSANPAVADAGFDRGITQSPSEPSVMGEWWLQLDPEAVAAFPDSALPEEAIKWLQEQGLR